MDSVTQLTLGAAVGTALMGRRAGRRAALWGAIAGTLPDLDVFIPMGEAVADFTYHRSFSHSLLVLAALTPLLVWLILKCHPHTRALRRRWAVTVYAVLATHVLLDSLTVYGTQIFWPLSDYPVSIGSVFIIDPAYTLPLLLGVALAMLSGHLQFGRRANAIGLLVSTTYLAWGLGAQAYVQQFAETSLSRQGITYERLLAQPTPFNSILWRIVATGPDHYRVGYLSLLDHPRSLDTRRIETSPELLQGLEGHWPVERLKAFTHGFYSVDRVGDAVVMSDLRMGIEPNYVFRFKVAEIGNPHPRPVASQRLPVQRDWDRLPLLWRRIWDRETVLTPSPGGRAN
ncbi:MAG: metal-dependent hydrolase [Gammaproteobacteria bacterium]